MTFEQLGYILSIEKYRNFTRAAEECFISQSSLSTHVSNLETELGVRIFDRNTRPVSITPSGEAVIDFARRTLENSSRLNNDLKKYSTVDSGSILLGILPSTSNIRFLSTLRKYQNIYPDIHFDFHEDVCNVLQSMLLRNELDVTLLADPEPNSGMNLYPYFSSDVVLAVGPDDPLAGKEKASATDLLNETFIVHKASPLFAYVKEYLKRELETPNIDDYLKTYQMHNTYILTDMTLAANGWGSVFVTRQNAEKYSWIGYKIVELEHPLVRNFYFATSKYSESMPIVQSFLHFLRKELTDVTDVYEK